MCRNCRLQWAEYADYFEKTANCINSKKGLGRDINEYYMSPTSIAFSAHYLPYRSFFKFLETRKPQGSLRILDIGCGNGVFLQECLRHGHDVIGIEADNTLREVISPSLLSRVIFIPVEKVDTFNQPFDVVTFWDSFEHLAGGFEVLDKLKTCLKKDGIIYLRVNNNHDIANLLTLFMLLLFPRIGKKMLKICFGFPHHAWNFSKTGMNNLLAKKRWQVISCCFNETPASRFTKNIFLRGIIRLAYLFNKIIRGGKIGEYYIGISAKG